MGLFRRRRRGGFFSRVFRAVGRVVGGVTRAVGSVVGGVARAAGSIVGGVAKGVGGAIRSVTDAVGLTKKSTGSSTMPDEITQKDFLIDETGRGAYEWPNIENHWNLEEGWVLDINGNGKVGLEDFKLAVYPEHKRYIRDYILANQFDRNGYLDVNGDGVVDIQDYYAAEDDTQKREIKKYVEDLGGCLTGHKMSGLLIHMVSPAEKSFLFSVQREIENGLKGQESGAIIRNISIDEIYEYNEAVQKYGNNIGIPMIRGVLWEGDNDDESVKSAIKVIQDKLPDRYAKYFHPDGRVKDLAGQRGTIFRIIKRTDSNIVDVKEILPEPEIDGFAIIISGDFEYGKDGDVFKQFENLVGVGDLEGNVRVSTIQQTAEQKIEEDDKKRRRRKGSWFRRRRTKRRRSAVPRWKTNLQEALRDPKTKDDVGISNPRRIRRRRRWGRRRGLSTKVSGVRRRGSSWLRRLSRRGSSSKRGSIRRRGGFFSRRGSSLRRSMR